MKKLYYITAIIGLALLFTSNSLAQESDEKTFELSNFDKLVIIGNFTTEIRYEPSKKEALVEVDDTEGIDLANLSFTYADNTLTIKYQGSFVKEIPMILTIQYNHHIQELEAKRGAIVRIDEGGKFEDDARYFVDNGSKILVKNVSAPKISAEISKGGSIRLTGVTNLLDAKVSMGGTIGAVNLSADKVVARVTMGGEILCAPSEELEAKVTSGGTINYKGNPASIDKKVSLGGTIEKL